MTKKTFALMAFSVFFLIALVGLASAASLSVSNVVGNDSTISQDDGEFSFTFELSNAGLEADINWSESTFSAGGVELSFSHNFIADGSTTTQTITVTVTGDFENNYFGTISGTIVANPSGAGSSAEIPYSITITESESYSLYDGENNGDLAVKNIEFKVVEGFGDDEDYWYPWDEVEVEFDIENNGDLDVKNIEITACLYDEERGKCVLDEDDMDISNDDFDLDAGDDDSSILSFSIDAGNLREGNTDYILYIAAVGEVDDRNSVYDGEKTGMQTEKEIEIVTDDDFVIVNNVELSPSTISCGRSLEITADIWNVGDQDLEDDEVYLNIYSKDLKLDEKISFEKGISAMDYESISYSLNIPEDADEGNYRIELRVYDDEDMSDSDLFENREGDESIFSNYFKVSGNCAIEAPAVSAEMISSEVKEGDEMQIGVHLTNNDEKPATFFVSAEGFNSWATLKETSPASITLDSGDSDYVYLTFDLKDNSEGEKQFNILVTSNNRIIANQPVLVSVKKGNFLGNIFESLDWKIVLIAALNLILLIAIIIVASRVLKKN